MLAIDLVVLRKNKLTQKIIYKICNKQTSNDNKKTLIKLLLHFFLNTCVMRFVKFFNVIKKKIRYIERK